MNFPTLFYQFMLRQLALPTLGCIAALGLPVILISLLGYLPAAALGTHLVWSALYGITPTALYLTLPIAVGVGVTWGYAQLSADGILAIVQSMRVSVLALVVPTLLLAAPIVVASYTISCWIAPRSVSSVQDVMFAIRNNLSLELFYPQTFYGLANNRYTLYFDRKLERNWVAGVFLFEQRSENESQTIVAHAAKLETHGDEQYIVFLNGTAQILSGTDDVANSLTFAQQIQPLGRQGSGVTTRRNWRGMFELGTTEFWQARQAVANNPSKSRAWMSEAVKRFGVPILGFAHPLAGLALVLVWQKKGGRGRYDPVWYWLPIIGLHMLILFCAEGIVYYGAWLGWFTASLIIAELIVALYAINFRQRHVPA